MLGDNASMLSVLVDKLDLDRTTTNGGSFGVRPHQPGGDTGADGGEIFSG
jgi:hypothetical protein